MFRLRHASFRNARPAERSASGSGAAAVREATPNERMDRRRKQTEGDALGDTAQTPPGHDSERSE
jgi:hypothetical protein